MLPLSSAIELGTDEGYELAKASLQARGYALYSQIWNDQPPLFTGILSYAFRMTEPSALVARLTVVAFSLLLLFSLFGLVSQRSGKVAASAGTLFLACSPFYLSLSSSVMQEVPAFSMAMASVWAGLRWRCDRRSGWVLLSGVLMGFALMIKFTAALVIPALVVEFVVWKAPRKESIKVGAIWGLMVFASCVCTAAAFGFGGISMLVQPHIRVGAYPGISKPADFAFPVELIYGHWEVYLCVLVALGVIWKKRLWSEATFPGILLLTVTIVHLMHRPWWYYYYPHHAIPLAWIAAILVREAIEPIERAFKASQLRLDALLAAATLSGLSAISFTRAEEELKRMQARPKIANSRILTRIHQYRDQTRWFYAQPVVYAFHARLPVPPELAVVTLKRYWSGEMTWQKLLKTVERYHPEQMLLLNSPMGPEWNEFLSTKYRLECEEGQMRLYVSKALKQVVPSSSARPNTAH